MVQDCFRLTQKASIEKCKKKKSTEEKAILWSSKALKEKKKKKKVLQCFTKDAFSIEKKDSVNILVKDCCGSIFHSLNLK